MLEWGAVSPGLLNPLAGGARLPGRRGTLRGGDGLFFPAGKRSEILPMRFLILFWIYAWPLVLTLSLVAATANGQSSFWCGLCGRIAALAATVLASAAPIRRSGNWRFSGSSRTSPDRSPAGIPHPPGTGGWSAGGNLHGPGPHRLQHSSPVHPGPPAVRSCEAWPTSASPWVSGGQASSGRSFLSVSCSSHSLAGLCSFGHPGRATRANGSTTSRSSSTPSGSCSG